MSAPSTRPSAVAIAAGSLLSVLAMAHHPTGAMHGSEDAGHVAVVARLVHGSLIALLVVVLHGFVGLAAVLGPRGERVRLALLAQALGVVALAGAALVSGFVVPDLAERYGAWTEAEREAAGALFDLCHATNQVLAQAGSLALSFALAAWGAALWTHGRAARVLGAAGVVVGAVPAAALVAGRLELDVRGMTAVVVAQSAWNVAAAVWLYRRRRER